MVMVIAGFMNDVQGYQQATTEAYGQTEYIEKGEKFIVPDIAPANLKIVF